MGDIEAVEESEQQQVAEAIHKLDHALLKLPLMHRLATVNVTAYYRDR